MGAYNGHESWEHWNVSLWINNDETLYRMAVAIAGRNATPYRDAEALSDLLQDIGAYETPDGAPYRAEYLEPVIAEMIEETA